MWICVCVCVRACVGRSTRDHWALLGVKGHSFTRSMVGDSRDYLLSWFGTRCLWSLLCVPLRESWRQAFGSSSHSGKGIFGLQSYTKLRTHPMCGKDVQDNCPKDAQVWDSPLKAQSLTEQQMPLAVMLYLWPHLWVTSPPSSARSMYWPPECFTSCWCLVLIFFFSNFPLSSWPYRFAFISHTSSLKYTYTLSSQWHLNLFPSNELPAKLLH